MSTFYVNPCYVVSVSGLEQALDGGKWCFTVSFATDSHVPSYTLQFADRREAQKAHGDIIQHMLEKEKA